MKKTGIDIIDRLSPEDRKLQRLNVKIWWQSLTHEQKVEHMNLLYDMVREKIRQHGGMISQVDAIKDFLNNDFPSIQEAGAQEMEQAGYIAIARSIREMRWGVDVFAIEFPQEEK